MWLTDKRAPRALFCPFDHLPGCNRLNAFPVDEVIKLNSQGKPRSSAFVPKPSSSVCATGVHIITVVSRAGKVASAKFGAYAALKFGMLGFTQTTDSEGIEFGVEATALCRGAVDTQQRAENNVDDHSKLLLSEDVADHVAFIVTRPARVYIGEASLAPQFMKPMPNSSNLKPGI